MKLQELAKLCHKIPRKVYRLPPWMPIKPEYDAKQYRKAAAGIRWAIDELNSRVKTIGQYYDELAFSHEILREIICNMAGSEHLKKED